MIGPACVGKDAPPVRIAASPDRGELPDAFVPGSTPAGSFDSVAASLRETATALRMRGYYEDRDSGSSGSASLSGMGSAMVFSSG